MNPKAPQANLPPDADAKWFFDSATSFHQAAERLLQDHHDGGSYLFQPINYCAFHAIELYLKAYLRKAKIERKVLASGKLGHNLQALLEQADRLDAIPQEVLDQHDRRSISWASIDYSTKCFEYPESMVSTLPIGQIMHFCNDLRSGLVVLEDPFEV